jgi:radical SAM superfamily enzyme YgiQ (UPF0313 family)
MSKILLLGLENKRTDDVLCDKALYEFRSRDRLWNTPHLGLLTVGAILAEKYRVDYLDLNYESVKDFNYEYVFISPSTSQATQAYGMAKLFKDNGVKVVFGGPHVTMLPEEALAHGDMVFIGEAEDSLRRFLRGDLQRIYIQRNLPDLKNTKTPLYALAVKYPYSSIPVQLSRGCPHQCEFCLSSAIYGTRLRRKTISQVEKELKSIKSLYKYPFIFFTDDNFLINTEFSLKVLELLQKLELKWYAFTDISIYKRSVLLKKLYSSGCRKLLLGFESLNEKNLDSINKSGFKSSKVKNYKEAIHTIQSEKIGVIGSFVLGLENDNEQTFEELYEFILDTKIYGTNITISTPFPGTKYYRRISKEQDLCNDWSLFDGFNLVYNIPGIQKDKFMNEYIKLITKINSDERLCKVIEFFKAHI